MYTKTFLRSKSDEAPIGSFSAFELKQILGGIWDNQICLTKEDLKTLRYFTSKTCFDKHSFKKK